MRTGGMGLVDDGAREDGVGCEGDAVLHMGCMDGHRGGCRGHEQMNLRGMEAASNQHPYCPYRPYHPYRRGCSLSLSWHPS